MTPFIVEGWNPLGSHAPQTDDQVFELLTAAVFQARFRPDVVQARWTCIRHAFQDFDLNAVAAWPENAVDALLEAEGMIRNPKKIRATLRNAKALKALGEQYTSVRAYLESFGDDGHALVKDIDKWAHYIGAPSIRWFVQCLEGD